MTIERVDVAALGPLSTTLGSGGQGTVYRVTWQGRPMAFKEYDEQIRRSLNESVLADLVELPTMLAPVQAVQLAERTAWPVALAERAGRVTGFLMPEVPARCGVRMRFPSGHRTAPGQVQLLLNDDAYLADRELPVHDRFRLEFLADLAATFELCHQAGLVVGDFSPNNVYFSTGHRPRCFLIDCDAMLLNGRSVLPLMETNDWQIPPPAGLNGNEAADSYKFALLCARLFAGDQTTQDLSALRRAGPAVPALAARCLTGGLAARPTMAEWRTALDDALTDRPSDAPPTPSTATTRITVPMPILASAPPAPAPRPAMPRTFSLAVRPGTVVKAVLAITLAVLITYPSGWRRDLVNLVTGAVAGATAGPSQPAATGSGGPAGQAAAFADVLAVSGQARTRVKAAITDVVHCRSLARAADTLTNASSGRARSLRDAAALRTDQLPDGSALKGQLVTALKHSVAADKAYARWAAAVDTDGCHSSAMNGSNRRRGDDESKLATVAKKKVATLWNPTATRYGHPTVVYLDI